LLIFALFIFEIFSYSSSKESLLLILGVEHWAKMLALAFCLLDFGGLAATFHPGLASALSGGKGNARYFLMSAWFIASMGDIFLLYLLIAYQSAHLSSNILVQEGILSARFVQTGLPIGFALLVAFIQGFLITRVGGSE
jgi:hypothetical protein